jgi:hypothetical protein
MVTHGAAGAAAAGATPRGAAHAAPAQTPPAFTAVLRRTFDLDGVSAASGLELSSDGRAAYVPGDDSVWLSELSLAPGADPSKVVRRVRLTRSRDVDAAGLVLSEDGIPKKVKPDFEAIALLPWGGSGGDGKAEERLAVFGSASKAGLRDGIALVDPATGAVAEYDAAALMAALRADARVTGSVKLNLEAAALVGGDRLALFQRGNVPGGFNSVVLIQLADFRSYLAALDAAAVGGSAAARPPPYTVAHLRLPPITEVDGERRSFPAGVSGASTFRLPLSAPASATAGVSGEAADEEFLLISASYEATLNEIDDGPVLGSRVALLPSRRLLAAASDAATAAAVASVDLSDVSALILPPAPAAAVEAGAAAVAAVAAAGPVLAKVEGVAPRGFSCGFAAAVAARGSSGGSSGLAHVIDVLAVTDPDGEGSQMLEVEVTAPVALLLRVAGLGEA